ncbi:hypothetical protein O5D80_003381 [Batrachochytrium dendrobatidis]|nr:hypothetical protein O5D80_003381 [Batrachochytrium dendrobatidis]
MFPIRKTGHPVDFSTPYMECMPWFSKYPKYETVDSHWCPSVDIYETPSDIVICMDLPGIAINQVKVELGPNQIVINGLSERSCNAEGAEYYVNERRFGKFYRMIPLPSGINSDDIHAQHNHGLLELKISKKHVYGLFHSIHL